jgi:2-amino-4-hydroxy-6-hydroxymethyldihydropteridine diphosphokinase
MVDSLHKAYILLGSNISPIENMRKAVNLLCKAGVVSKLSTVWETMAVGSSGPNFLNAVVLLNTNLTILELKEQSLYPIETLLGRIRTRDKNAPRPIDLDIIIFDDEIQDLNVWTRIHICVPMAEIAPGMIHPDSKRSLDEVADSLLLSGWAKPHPEIHLGENC